jgi:hypothetical protein
LLHARELRADLCLGVLEFIRHRDHIAWVLEAIGVFEDHGEVLARDLLERASIASALVGDFVERLDDDDLLADAGVDQLELEPGALGVEAFHDLCGDLIDAAIERGDLLLQLLQLLSERAPLAQELLELAALEVIHSAPLELVDASDDLVILAAKITHGALEQSALLHGIRPAVLEGVEPFDLELRANVRVPSQCHDFDRAHTTHDQGEHRSEHDFSEHFQHDFLETFDRVRRSPLSPSARDDPTSRLFAL